MTPSLARCELWFAIFVLVYLLCSVVNRERDSNLLEEVVGFLFHGLEYEL